MGILNVTPDSFSDGGKWSRRDSAVVRARALVAEGADLIDVGGESTRPGSDAVALEEELERVVPVIEALAREEEVPLSVDTCKPEVARQALAAGASVVNDISGLRDPEMVRLCAQSDCGVVVMHMKGVPKTMQAAPFYEDVVAEVRDYFVERLRTLEAAGIARERLCWDPGIGFGKRLQDNLALLHATGEFTIGGCPVMMGLSRKSFLGELLGEKELSARDWATVGLTAWTRERGALIHRVHEVRPNREALRFTEALLD
ncbi:dihydropteroate synthase [Roseibacillus ishigakijimensis]|uniref:Dihydropteroate synthase n=2 Tax=Roseibacillus ishigakijimensis TaxID=454146 RepID=A0A934RT01_9BACT|nr:dihydropteroate synthase [Roseibacillus ishigakijimensis]